MSSHTHRADHEGRFRTRIDTPRPAPANELSSGSGSGPKRHRQRKEHPGDRIAADGRHHHKRQRRPQDEAGQIVARWDGAKQSMDLVIVEGEQVGEAGAKSSIDLEGLRRWAWAESWRR
mgnify:CR=1 FL=1